MKKTLYLVLAGLFTLTGALHADQTLYFDSVTGTYAGHNYGAEAYGGPYYISPYFGHVDSNPSGSMILFCLDFDHFINVPDQTTAVLRTLPADGTFQDSKYQFESRAPGSNPNDLLNGPLPTTVNASNVYNGSNISSLTAYQRYEAAIYLLNLDLTAAGPPVQNSRGRALYQYAMWALFIQNGPPDGAPVFRNAIANIESSKSDAAFGADVDALVWQAYNEVTNAANQSYLAGLLPYFTVVSATSNPTDVGNKYQEFLTITSPPAVPEPSSIVLLGSVLIGIGTLIRKRRMA